MHSIILYLHIGIAMCFQYPLLRLKSYKMFTADTIACNTKGTYCEIPKYFTEIEYQCNSSYPTRWIFSRNTYEDDNLQGIPKVTKSKLPLNANDITAKPTSFTFSSTLLFKFKKTDDIQNVTCSEIKTRNQHGTTLNSTAFTRNLTHTKIALVIKNGTGPQTNNGEEGARRFGKNPNCALSLYVFVEKIVEYACINEDNTWPTKTLIIQCNNPDECSSFSQANKNCDVSFCNTSDCGSKVGKHFNWTSSFVPNGKPGVVICSNGVSNRADKYLLNIAKTIVLGEDNNRDLKKFIASSPESMQDAYDGMEHKFVCNASMFDFVQGIQWKIIVLSSQKEQIFVRRIPDALEKLHELDQIISSTVTVKFNKSEADQKTFELKLVCEASVWNEQNLMMSSIIDITILESFEPKDMEIVIDEEKHLFNCSVSSQPIANISWRLTTAGENKTDVFIPNNYKTQGINWAAISLKDSFMYEGKLIINCTAKNFKGSLSKEREFFKMNSDGSRKIVNKEISIVLGVIAILILALLTLFVILKIKRENSLKLTDAEIEEFENGAQNESNNNPILLPYNVKFEIPQENLSMDGGVLGSGYFGIVKKGEYNLTPVAIKTVKKSVEIMHFKALLSELKIMCHIGNHPNLVNLIGACTKNIRKQEVYIVVEFCCNGNLVKLLRNSRNSFVNHYVTIGEVRQSVVHYVNADGKKLSTRDLVKWSAEIACGMEFLSSKNVIHGDLAARNVLISSDMTAKLCDFGLSKQLFDYTVYVQKPQKPLPLKWMATESLRDLEFSLESDIWSYGVTIWEVFSMGLSPYPGLQWDYNSWHLLEGGYRMSKPEFCNDSIYEIMIECWNKNPKSRPAFGRLATFFQNELTKVNKLPQIGKYT